ncbi:MAG: alanine--tRNA ligase [Candidatus ainarchaeum sp.]|nr:alanine--tRNA ligase [Candidatus ainarchaeum sp.]
MDIDKNELRRQFTKDWKKHYDVHVLKEHGFSRQQCKKCNRWFWAQEEREFCADASCIGYRFIGNSPCKRKLEYVEAWKEIEKYFIKHGHKSLKPYPTVARWRDDLYFTVASINNFQPYVVSGELPPPANPLIIPQPCIRFPDISNVGVSGRHYTNFVMIGQHAFNTKKTGMFYWKDEALGHDIHFMKELGIPTEKLVFIEDVWAGGGNFGPCIEYFVDGLELGNCVFMQYEIVEGKTRELSTKVIDMGAGLERFPWITQGTPTSYSINFRRTADLMKKMTGIKVDEKAYLEYAKLSGTLNADEVDIETEKRKIRKIIGDDFVESLKPLQAIYASADHILTVLFSSTDGMLPSNSGGGYNLRMVLRRVFGFEEEFNFSFDFDKIIQSHATERKEIFPNLENGVETTIDVIKEEKRKYLETKEKAKGKVSSLLAKKSISDEEFILLYKSHGIPPESIVDAAKKQGIELEIPKRFYERIQEGEGEQKIVEEKEEIDVENVPKTKKLYYTEIKKFKAKVIAFLHNRFIILDQTAFYPEGGGQTADTGTINNYKIINVINEKGVVLHEVSKQSEVKILSGSVVDCDVDIDRRKKITRHHTAAHLVNAACREILGRHIWQAGSQKDEYKGHLDVTHYKRIEESQLKEIELKVNEYIQRNIPIEIEILNRNVAEEQYGFTLYQGGAVPGKELRIVKIGDIDAEACGGTHHNLKSTGEIGCFVLVISTWKS